MKYIDIDVAKSALRNGPCYIGDTKVEKQLRNTLRGVERHWKNIPNILKGSLSKM